MITIPYFALSFGGTPVFWNPAPGHQVACHCCCCIAYAWVRCLTGGGRSPRGSPFFTIGLDSLQLCLVFPIFWLSDLLLFQFLYIFLEYSVICYLSSSLFHFRAFLENIFLGLHFPVTVSALSIIIVFFWSHPGLGWVDVFRSFPPRPRPPPQRLVGTPRDKTVWVKSLISGVKNI